MFFTKIGQAVAWFCVVGGFLHLAYLMSKVAIDDLAPHHPAWARINEIAINDYKMIAFGLILGIFAKISISISKMTTSKGGAEPDPSRSTR